MSLDLKGHDPQEIFCPINMGRDEMGCLCIVFQAVRADQNRVVALALQDTALEHEAEEPEFAFLIFGMADVLMTKAKEALAKAEQDLIGWVP